MKSFLKYWLPVLIWLGLIFVGSTDALSAEQTSRFLVPFLRWLDPQISGGTIAAIQLALRKLGHITEYAILAMLLWRGLSAGDTLSGKMCLLFLVCCVAWASFAVTDEIYPSIV